MIGEIVQKRYTDYVALLKSLASINTVYHNTEGLDRALRFCASHLQRHLPSHHVHFDDEGNVVCASDRADPRRPVLYLSAHIDTVGADGQQWDAPFEPFNPYEDDDVIVARGVNDCKAGVAYQLFLAALFDGMENVVFTVSRREEQGGTSARAIAAAVGRSLPVGSVTYALILENTMTVSPAHLTLYQGEKGSIGVELTADIVDIRRLLTEDENPWNPTSIRPLNGLPGGPVEDVTQGGGHAASVPREQNALYQLLIEERAPEYAYTAGDASAISSIPTVVRRIKVSRPAVHNVVFDLRTTKASKQLVLDLRSWSIDYRFVKNLAYGYDVGERLRDSPLSDAITRLNADGARIKVGSSSGLSDAGLLYNVVDRGVRKSFIPVVCGPGCGSQRDVVPPRLTHGVNETFDKKAGLLAVTWISRLIERLGLVR